MAGRAIVSTRRDLLARSRNTAAMTQPTVEVLDARTIDEADLLMICAIWRYVFPPNPLKTLHTDMAQQHALAAESVANDEHVGHYHVTRDAGRIIAVAKTFVRTIAVADTPRPVLALMGVACLPDFRGRGYGAAVVRSAFARLQSPTAPASVILFQTEIARQFYEKLGCRIVPNRFINSVLTPTHTDRDANPWWNQWVMIHPTDADWPDDAPIDLRGPGW
jgi:GNAT superfamily N-acetyltransferase